MLNRGLFHAFTSSKTEGGGDEVEIFDPSTVGATGWWSPRFGYSNGTLEDQIGTRNLTQSVSTQRPSVLSAELNGQDVLHFDGVDDFLLTANYGLAHPTAVFIVYKYYNSEAPISNDTILDGLSSNSLRLIARTNSFSLRASTVLGLFSDLNVNTWYIGLGIWNGANSLMSLGGSNNLITGDCGTGSPDLLSLGATSSGNRPVFADVAELIIFQSNPSTSNLNYCGNGLANFYNLTWTNFV